ncbi:hypothetical protein K435DRAFT_931166, partial [Dendrothele bispora CBS 962.96]
HAVTEELTIATGGQCLNNGNDNARAGAGIYVEKGHPMNRSVKLPLYLGQSNQTGELVATKMAAELTDPDMELKIETDSSYVITMLTTKKNQKEDDGYIGMANGSALIRSTITSLRGRKGKTLFKWVEGHERNKGAVEMARKALERDKASLIHLSATPTLQMTGVKLRVMTQALAYKAVTLWKVKATKRQRTNRNILNIKDTTQQRFAYLPTKMKIWKSIRHKDIERKTRYFLWMAIHDAYMTDTHWLRPGFKPELQERVYCPHCDAIEDLYHI